MNAIARVLIADDHPLFREALSHVILEVAPGAVCVEASGYAEAVTLTSEDERFDLIFVDLMMPGGGDLAELASLRRRVPLTPVIVVSSLEDWPTIRRVMACGVAGYIPKSASKNSMETAIRRILAGNIYVPEDVIAAETLDGAQAAALERLTPRQHGVLEMLARGSSNRQIAADLCIEEVTVKAHISAILSKLGVKNRLQAVLASRALLDGLHRQ